MDEVTGQDSEVPSRELIHTEGNTLIIKLGAYTLSLKIEGPEPRPARLKLGRGQTIFDLVLEAARTLVRETGRNEFSPAELYHTAKEKHPDLDLKRNSWSSHVMSSAPNHPSYRYYTARRKFFRYHGGGRYSLEPAFTT